MESEEIESEQRGLPLSAIAADKSGTRDGMLTLAFPVVFAVLAVVSLVLGWHWALTVVFGLLFLLGAAAAFRHFRGASKWENPQLFWPSGDPLRLGETVTARYRRNARRAGLTDGANLTAMLVCTERIRVDEAPHDRTEERTVYDVPVAVTMYPHPKMVEADMVVHIPLFAAPPTMDLGNNEVLWRLMVDGAADQDEKTARFPVVVAADVTPEAVE